MSVTTPWLVPSQYTFAPKMGTETPSLDISKKPCLESDFLFLKHWLHKALMQQKLYSSFFIF